MSNLTETEVDYVIFGIFCLVMLIILIVCRGFVLRALSEGDKPSSKRLGGFLLVLVICFNETFTTLKTKIFEYNHLVAILVGVMLCWGIATVPQILEVWKGGAKHPENKPDENKDIKSPPVI
jgi:hypothetical protein